MTTIGYHTEPTQVKPQKNGDLLFLISLPPIPHPELEDEIKENYSVVEGGLNKEFLPPIMFLHYYRHGNVLNEHMAQILKHKHQEEYLLVCRMKPITQQQTAPYFKRFDSYESAIKRYKTLFRGMLTAYIENVGCGSYFFNGITLTPDHEITPKHEMINQQQENVFDSKLYGDKLDGDVKEFVKLFIFDYTNTDTIVVMRNDLSKTAVGYPTKEAIALAFKVLESLAANIKILVRGPPLKPTRKLPSPAVGNSIENLSNLFHMLIPCCSREFDKQIPIIDSLKKVYEKRELTKALQSEAHREILLYPFVKKASMLLGRLGYPLRKLDLDDPFPLSVGKCINNTSNRTPLKLLNVYSYDTSLTIPDNELLWHGTLMLWHGTTLENVYNILENGLEPSNLTGRNLFGKGIYFSDAVTRAAPYCGASKANPDGVFLLCEVSHGQMKQVTVAERSLSEAPPGFDSVKGIGKYAPDTNTFFVDNFGSKFYCEKIKQNNISTTLNYNEYVVYNKSQVKIRYLIHVKFNYR